MADKKTQKLEAAAFAWNNGLIMRTFTLLQNERKPLAAIGNLLKKDGLSEDEFITGVRFLSEKGYLDVRQIGAEAKGSVVDNHYTELEAIISCHGIDLMMGECSDGLVEV